MCTLIARWTWNQNPGDPPYTVFWGDGRPANYVDYARHRFDTYEISETEEYLEKRMYSWLVADVRYDAFFRCWFLVPPGREPLALELRDPDASDA